VAIYFRALPPGGTVVSQRCPVISKAWVGGGDVASTVNRLSGTNGAVQVVSVAVQAFGGAAHGNGRASSNTPARVLVSWDPEKSPQRARIGKAASHEWNRASKAGGWRTSVGHRTVPSLVSVQSITVRPVWGQRCRPAPAVSACRKPWVCFCLFGGKRRKRKYRESNRKSPAAPQGAKTQWCNPAQSRPAGSAGGMR